MTIVTKFDRDEIVKIIPLEHHTGRVMNIYFRDRVEYNIRYFQDGKMLEVYFHEDELQKFETDKF